MAPHLKVFTWSDGFHAFTVAASSRPKALAAWGSGQDLFATELASELSGGPDFDAALATPGEVIQRGLAVDIGRVAKARTRKAASGPSKAKRERIERAELALEQEDERHRSAARDVADRRAALDQEEAVEQRRHDARRRKLVAALKTARG
jgi:hypothetical protein